MTDQEKLAREWAEYYQDDWPKFTPGTRAAELVEKAKAAAQYILEHTDPPTMADVDWDDEKYFLAGATDSDGDPCVMVKDRLGDEIWIIDPSLQNMYRLPTYKLTPNGKRYELREVTKPDHPVQPSTKTMDEYSPAERADMVGMWAGYNRHKAGGEPEDFLIITGEETEARRVPCYNPGAPIPHAWAPDKWMLTPRFDIPRAWDKNGKPYEPTVSSDENVGAEQYKHPESSYTVQTSDENPPTEKSWVEVDHRGMHREDYMEWKSWKWLALEGEPLTLEEAVNAVSEGAGYKRPYRINRGTEVVLTVFPEPDKPDHPEVLETVEDYKNAPEGTLAASMHGEGYFHNETMYRWESTHGDWKNYAEMESSSSGRMVLRWGWGGEA